ncbi:MAG: dienelactone hydrolase family protein [Candidatus Binatia bacterium]
MLRIPIVLTFALLAACGAKKSPPPAVTDEPAAPPSVDERIAGTGPLSEAEFKAMHELRDDAPPAAKGETIDLAGTKAYLSLPEGKTPPVAAVVVIHEWWGLNDHIKHWADRLASLGIAALAVDLYGGVVATDPDSAMKTMKAVKEADARKVLAAAVDFLGKDARVQASRRGVIGWCFGGAWSLETAIDQPVDAAVVYYGHVDTDPARLAKVKAEILGIFAKNDKGIPPEHVDRFEKALGEAKVRATIKRYDADHAFGNPSSPRYDHEDAAAAWEEVVAFFGRTLLST